MITEIDEIAGFKAKIREQGDKWADFGEVALSDWDKIVKEWKAMFGGGKILCRHVWGKFRPLPPATIGAYAVYPSGVKVPVSESKGAVTVKCAKCGKVKGFWRIE
jgi:hypothetical protein